MIFLPRFAFFMNFCPWRATKLRSLQCGSLKRPSYNVEVTFTLHLHYRFHVFLQNVIWLNTRTGLRYKRHILHAPKYE